MYLAYIDASGTSLPFNKDNENYVLSAAITNERDWQIIDNSIRQIKLNFFPQLQDEYIEFHAKEMLNRSGIYENIDWNEIYRIFQTIFDYISKPSTNLVFVSILIEKLKIRTPMDIEKWAHKLLFERINYFMNKVNQTNMERFYPNEFCIMITDTEGEKKDSKLRKKIAPILTSGLDNLLEDVFFTDSKLRNLSQISDCIAYCVRKRHRKGVQDSLHIPYWYKFYEQISIKFDSNPNTGEFEGYGLKIFPK